MRNSEFSGVVRVGFFFYQVTCSTTVPALLLLIGRNGSNLINVVNTIPQQIKQVRMFSNLLSDPLFRCSIQYFQRLNLLKSELDESLV